MTPLEASKVLAMLMAAYPNARVPDGTVALYESFLVELERDRCVRAVRGIITTSKFMPTIAEIVTAYRGEKGGEGEGEPYQQPFLPPKRGRCMRPAELKTAIDDFLAQDRPKPEAAE